ncbi:MAG TPA: tRNA-specific 2-thiouridylase, partial [Syntrophales bacterium]|nr:tRNA-specific 2-thiouridylase [Syntrophales bacterium]
MAVAMSGGVDSSVAALLLKEAGYEVVGFTMLREGTSVKGGKVSDQEVEEAKKVCSFLGIEHFLLNVTQTLEEKVIKPFIQEYREGKTPNPCVNCNRFVKFGALWDEIALRGFDYLATGHYARLQEKDGRPVLMKARDISKDQSYFLHAVDRASLAKVIFPLGDYTKTQVRQWAKERRIPTAERK